MVGSHRRALIAIAVVGGACGDNRALPPDAAAIDAPGVGDLALVGAEMDGTVTVTNDVFEPDSCEVVEGCAIEGPRRLLRFATVTENRGTAPIDLGLVPPAGESSGIFTWSPCHMHHHVIGYADYELASASGVVATGRKQGFCIEDDERESGGGGIQKFNCRHQGLSVGWADVYGNDLPCQWIDITNVPAGTYTLKVTVDKTNVIPDSDPTDNDWTTEVTF